MKPRPLFFSDVQVGDLLSTKYFEVTKEKAEKYTRAVGDENLFYLNPEAAAQYGLQGELVPPTAIVLFCRLFPAPPGTVHVGQEFSFFRPLQVGDTLRAQGEIINKFEKKNHKFVSYRVLGSNQREQAVFSAVMTLILPNKEA